MRCINCIECQICLCMGAVLDRTLPITDPDYIVCEKCNGRGVICGAKCLAPDEPTVNEEDV